MFKREATSSWGRAATLAFFDTPGEFIEKAGGAREYYWETHWMGGTREEVTHKFNVGDNALVEQSDKALDELEGKFEVMSSGFKVVDAVTGGAPNVPAVVSNLPITMRRRQRSIHQQAPLTIIMDLTSSAAVNQDELIARGAALLALTRLMSARRPVTLWCGVALNKGAGAGGAFFRVDTSPLDLSRAAHYFACSGVARGFGYGWLSENLGCAGSWPFTDVDHWRREGESLFKQVVDEDILFVPPIHLTDDIMVRNPALWLANMVKQYGGEAVEA
jgi:hypothetical protein